MRTLTRAWIAGLSLVLLGGSLAAGCGGGSSSGASLSTPAAVSSGQGSVTAAVSAIETSLLSSALRSGSGAALLGTAASPPDLDNCTESIDSGSGSGFSVVCLCTVDGQASGTITATFDSGKVEQSCQRSDGSSGPAIGLSGSVTITFDACALEGCGERLTLTGSATGTVEYVYSGCTLAETISASFSTANTCSGVTVTHADSSTDEVGFSATWSSGSSGDAQGGSACVDGESTDLSGLDAICEAQSGASCSEATVSCASDFACQLFADNSSTDAFNTDNVACVSGCCVVQETGRCSDGKDNDFDGTTDCSDSDCSTDPYCLVGPCGSGTVSCSSDFACQTFADSDQTDAFTTNNVTCSNSCCVALVVSESGRCTDGTDNDQDAAADCADSDCAGDLACGGRLPCTNEWQCRALVAGTQLATATPTCIRYDVGHQYYSYNDGSCQYDCTTAASPADCMGVCIPLARTMPQGGYANHVDQFCRFYPPTH